MAPDSPGPGALPGPPPAQSAARADWRVRDSELGQREWLARLALADAVTPAVIAVVARSAGITGSAVQWREMMHRLGRAGLLQPAAPDQTPEVGRLLTADTVSAMLHDLDTEDLAKIRAQLLQAAHLLGALEQPRPGLSAQLAKWARQNEDWKALELIWIKCPSTELLGREATNYAFGRTPVEQRMLCPGLSEAAALATAVRPGGAIDRDGALRNLVEEGRLHAGWGRQPELESAVLAGTLWMTAAGSFPLETVSPDDEAWQIHLAISERIRDGSVAGRPLNPRIEAQFHGCSAVLALARALLGTARREAELAVMLSDDAELPFLVGATVLLAASSWSGDQRGIFRSQALIDRAKAKNPTWWPFVQPSIRSVQLARACCRLDHDAASQQLSDIALDSPAQWFALHPADIFPRTIYGLLWSGPGHALAEFYTQLPAPDLEPGSLGDVIFPRLKAELLLNLGLPTQAEEVIAAQPADSLLMQVPLARLQLCGGRFPEAVATTDRALAFPETTNHDRAQLLAIRAAARSLGGGSDVEVVDAIESACRFSTTIGSLLCFAMLPAPARDALLQLHTEHADASDCPLLQAVESGAFALLRQGYVFQQAVMRLTRREKELLPLLASPASVPEIAESLFVSVNTVRKQVVTLREKFGVHSRADLVNQARELGLL